MRSEGSRSAAWRVIGPAERTSEAGLCGIMPCVGFSAATPQWLAGSRTEPAMSEPTAIMPMPAAIEAPPPALEPPAFHARPQGLRTMP